MHGIVVGAGLAGLGAALSLSDAGHRVTVIESRDRLGGRVFSHRWGGLVAELGGEWIDSGHLRMLALCRRFGLALRADGAEQCSYIGGRAVLDTLPEDDWTRGLGRSGLSMSAQDAVRRLVAARAAYAARLAGAAPDPALLAYLDGISVAKWLAERGAPVEAEAWLGLGILGDFAAPLDRISLLYLVRAYEAAPPAASSRIVGGNDLLPQAMAEAIRGEIYVGLPVEAIGLDDAGGVRVMAGARSFRGDAAVLALPCPALRRLSIDPPLPPAQRAALDACSYGAITKRIFPCTARPWPADPPRWWFTDLPGQVLYETTAGQEGAGAILTAYTPAAGAAILDEATALADLERLFPGAARSFSGLSLVKAWAEDPWAGGAYATFEPGYLTRHAPSLGQPQGALAFAGEHIAPEWTGHMEGALASGQAAARYVAAWGVEVQHRPAATP